MLSDHFFKQLIKAYWKNVTLSINVTLAKNIIIHDSILRFKLTTNIYYPAA
tara:strand:- start:1157 stop:1309 length:153 start_codon:yes stop_codon:yes gene_type:complete